MTLKNSRVPLLCYFKLCALFHSHLWIQTGATVQKCPIWVKIDDFFLAVWPWNLTDDLEKQQGTCPKQHQALCSFMIICEFNLELRVRKHLSWVFDLIDLDLWPWLFAWTSLLSLVISSENFMMIGLWEHSEKSVTDWQTDRPTDQPTDRPTVRQKCS